MCGLANAFLRHMEASFTEIASAEGACDKNSVFLQFLCKNAQIIPNSTQVYQKYVISPKFCPKIPFFRAEQTHALLLLAIVLFLVYGEDWRLEWRRSTYFMTNLGRNDSKMLLTSPKLVLCQRTDSRTVVFGACSIKILIRLLHQRQTRERKNLGLFTACIQKCPEF